MKTTDIGDHTVSGQVQHRNSPADVSSTVTDKTTNKTSALQGNRDIAKYEIRRIDSSAAEVAVHSGSLSPLCLHALVCLTWLLYFGTQFQCCLRGSATNTKSAVWHSWVLFVCEVILAGPEFFQIVELSLSILPGSRQRPRAGYRLEGDDAPLVHVFITTCGEASATVVSTLAGAIGQNYPKACYRVFVLDDARDRKLQLEIESVNKQTCEMLGTKPVVYLARAKTLEGRQYYKAGNLSFGIQTSKDEYGSSEFIAGLDADMIVEPDWLRRVVPHLVLSPELAVVSPPQSFYNVPDGDILAQDASVLQNVLEPARDRIGCSMCHGSGYVMRREALESIGGWPLVNIGEDILCSYLLNQGGWQTAFIKDELQFGVTCESFHAYVSQRMRWTAGNLLSAQRFRLFLPYLEQSKITVIQRLHGFMQSVKTYFWIALILPMVVLPFGLMLPTIYLPYTARSAACSETVRYSFVAMWVTTKLWKRKNFGHVGARNLFNLSNNRLWITPYIVCAYWQSLWCDLEDTTFEISGTFQSPLNERSTQERPNFWKRMSNPLIVMHTLYWCLASSALVIWLWSIAFGDSMHLHHLTGLTIRLFEIALATFIPVKYMCFPPFSVAPEERIKSDVLGADRAMGKTWTQRVGNELLCKHISELLIIIVCIFIH
ncbi:glycosyltransferase family 2 protein [Cercospora zeae-maydis SCOH1-5]|uniref:Glycosyltransferase family 2 protein n=1 Tax=Cercospora zeae-maydis SCOH1-5 TaxID=717836 RepID=A0A6A6F248_9PEZI|nr:glycosyltransferase family 2 protein [Cercospora zeae-maydis SCOH1-5]